MALVYPASLPVPQTSTVTPKERRAFSDPDYPREAVALERDRSRTEAITWPPMNAAQLAVFWAWWRDDLIYGGAWFAATWPIPEGMVASMRKFLEVPRREYHAPGYWQLSVRCEVRGLSDLSVSATDENFEDVVLLLRGNNSDDLSSFGHIAELGTDVVFDDTTPIPGVAPSAIKFTQSLDCYWNYSVSIDWVKSSSFTLEFWIYIYGSASNEQFMGINGSNFRFFQIFANGDPDVECGIQLATWMGSVALTISKNEWHHLVLVYDSDLGAFYIDGELQHRDGSTASDLTPAGFRVSNVFGYAPFAKLAEIRYTQNLARYNRLDDTIPIQSAPWPDH